MNKKSNQKTQVLVLGSGPGGYAAAFYAADRKKSVVLVERDNLGGVCLNIGCIPSKTLLHAAKVIEDAKDMADKGVIFTEPKIDIPALRASKEKVVKQLTMGLAALAKQRNVTVIKGEGHFIDAHHMQIDGEHGKQTISFEQAIIAAGSRPIQLPFAPNDDERILDSTGALELKAAGKRLLVIGGGIIGLEMVTLYQSLGTEITIVEMTDQLIEACDADIVKPLHQRLKKRCKDIWLSSKVTAIEAKKDGIWVKFEGKDAPKKPTCFDYVLVAVGRTPNGKLIAADKAGVNVSPQGFIPVDQSMRTNVEHIFAIGDVVGQPMLAHKATHEGHVAAAVIAGKRHIFSPKVIPSVAYTDPEIAWAGVLEKEAKQQKLNYDVATFPWIASGRALSMGRSEGLTKLIVDKDTGCVIGGAIVGIQAGDLISEVALAIEMGCDIEDIGLTIHPHPTLSETLMLASEMLSGTITDLVYKPKKRRN